VKPRKVAWGALAFCLNLAAQTHTAADLGKAVLAAGLDPNECYRIRDVEISEEDARIYLSEGYLMFGRPVNGAPLTAVFSADTEGGDGEILLLPPTQSERKSMAAYTGSPNLNEHFAQAAFIFTEAGARALIGTVQKSGARKTPDIGAIMMERWNRVVANIIGSFESRIVLDLLTPGERSSGYFEAVIQGKKLDDFDVLYDARGYEQMVAGQIVNRKETMWWDTWTSFASRDRRGQPPPEPEEKILSYRIEATLDSSLHMQCVTHMRVKATEESRNLLAFDLSGRMHATSAKVDGQPAEVYERDSVRSGLVQNNGNELLLVLPAKPLDPGSEHDVEIAHEGNVVIDAGHKVYFVSARGSWYPGRGVQFATYDTTWRYPANLQMVSPGKATEDRTEGDMQITRRVPEGPLRILGFNLGEYDRKDSAKNGIGVEVLANKQVEDALRPKPAEAGISEPMSVRRKAATTVGAAPGPPPVILPRPADQLTQIADQVEDSMVWYTARFGDPPIRTLTVSPQPANFGQGFGGMIYLPTLNYVTPDHSAQNENQGFFRDLLLAHETAHQWWGNVVTSGSYHHEWLMESLANYSAMMYLESKMGPKAIEIALERYRKNLFVKGPDGETAESEGAVVQGRRLESSINPEAAVAVMYGKGSWILHMLRRRMGDDNFMKALAETRRRFEWKPMDTEDFRAICAQFLPAGGNDAKLENFFDQWVYGTGVPTLKLSFAVKGGPGAYKLTGTVTQSDAPDDFSVAVPVEIQTGRGKSVQILRTSSDEPVSFTVNVAAANAKAVLDPGWSVLRR
jgi:hypothetical protein